MYFHHLYLHSFPTRRSSDLLEHQPGRKGVELTGLNWMHSIFSDLPPDSWRESGEHPLFSHYLRAFGDRKSTRLNSSHANISYAVFCLKKKMRKKSYDSKLKL